MLPIVIFVVVVAVVDVKDNKRCDIWSQIRQMPTWTDCVTFPHPHKT